MNELDVTLILSLQYKLAGIQCVFLCLNLAQESLYHCIQLGACPMKPRDKGGVVDPRLNVYGIQGLKVAGMCAPFSALQTSLNNVSPRPIYCSQQRRRGMSFLEKLQ